MRTLTYQLRDLKKVNIEIGFEGENNRTQVRIDCGEVFAEYPNAEAALKVQAPKGGIYPATVTRDGNMILWTVRDCDVANNGNGELQLTFTDGETVVKSCKGRIHIDKSLKGSGTAPSGVQDWLDRAEEALEGVEAAEIHQPMIGLDGYWYKWDQEAQQYVSTGTKAQGQDGVGIASIVKTGTVGLVDTYTITFTNGTETTYTVTNGEGGNVIDDTAPAANKVYSSSKVEAELTPVKNALDGVSDLLVQKRTANNVTEWEQGALVATTGGTSSSSSAVRTRGRIGSEHHDVVCSDGFVMNVYVYDEDGTYLGVYKKSNGTIVKDGVAWYDSANLHAIANGKKYTFQLVIKLDAGGSVVPADASNVSIETYMLDVAENEIYAINESALIKGNGSALGSFIFGSVDGASGGLTSANNCIRTMGFMPDGVKYIESTDSYVFYLFAYDKVSGQYIGCWDRGSKTYKSSVGTWYNLIYVDDLKADNYNLRLCVKKSNGATFAINDALPKVSIIIDDIAKHDEIIEKIDRNSTIKNQADDIVAAMAESKHQSKAAYIPPLTLLHFSDIHNNTGNYQFIIDFKRNHPVIDDMLNTGDLVGDNYSANQVLAYFSAFNADNYALLALGNHDSYSSGSTKMSQSSAYGYYIAPTVEAWGAEYTANKTYWYKDYDDSGIRLIGIDSQLEGADMTAQVSWLADVLADAKTNDLAVVIAGHCPPTTQTGTKIDCSFTSFQNIPSSSDINALDENGAGIMAAVDTFMSGGGEFICYLMGHWHLDFVMYSSNYPNQLIIDVGTAACTDGPNAYSDVGQRRDVGTIYQHLFNVFSANRTDGLIKLVRIGADRDMHMKSRRVLCYDYKNHAVIYSE